MSITRQLADHEVLILRKELASAWAEYDSGGTDHGIPALEDDYGVALDDPFREQPIVTGDENATFVEQEEAEYVPALVLEVGPRLVFRRPPVHTGRVAYERGARVLVPAEVADAALRRAVVLEAFSADVINLVHAGVNFISAKALAGWW